MALEGNIFFAVEYFFYIYKIIFFYRGTVISFDIN